MEDELLKESLQSIIHTILFHRILFRCRARDVNLEAMDVCYVRVPALSCLQFVRGKSPIWRGDCAGRAICRTLQCSEREREREETPHTHMTMTCAPATGPDVAQHGACPNRLASKVTYLVEELLM